MEGGDKEAVLEAAVKRFQELRSREQQLLSKISEMASQEQEFRFVCVQAGALGRARAGCCPQLSCRRAVGARPTAAPSHPLGAPPPFLSPTLSTLAASSSRCWSRWRPGGKRTT